MNYIMNSNMQALIIRLFKDTKHQIKYAYVSPARFKDDVSSWDPNNYFNPPMIEVDLYEDDGTFIERAETYATPEIVKYYTGIDMFNGPFLQEYSIRGRSTILDCVWKEVEYPYINVYDSRDYTKTEKYKILEVLKFKDYWNELLNHHINFKPAK